MCGIAGFNWKESNLLEKMLISMKSRGPDDQGIYESKNISLGHNRLSIIIKVILMIKAVGYSDKCLNL